VLAILIGAVAYFVALSLLQLYHRRHPRVAARARRRRISGVVPRPEIPPECDETGTPPDHTVN